MAKHPSISLAVAAKYPPNRDDGGKASAKTMVAIKHPLEKQTTASKHPLETNNIALR
jgi:hypothetical protein